MKTKGHAANKMSVLENPLDLPLFQGERGFDMIIYLIDVLKRLFPKL